MQELNPRIQEESIQIKSLHKKVFGKNKMVAKNNFSSN